MDNRTLVIEISYPLANVETIRKALADFLAATKDARTDAVVRGIVRVEQEHDR